MSSSQIQFRYALDENGKVVSINDVPIEYSKRGRYFFPGTGAEMIARKGKKVAWHFAHKDGNPGALETYLHNTGKYLFKQVFEASDKFTISLQAPAVCVHAGDCPVEERYPCHFKDYTTFDLKVYYDKCVIEKDFTVGDDTFRPDVLLLPKNAKHDPIFVEIEVTHASTYKKRYSGIRIIEIKLENEDDFNLIEKCHIGFQKKVNLYGFDVKKPVRRDRVANKKSIYSLRAEGEYGFTHCDDCFYRCSQDDWYSKNEEFAVFFSVFEVEKALHHRQQERLAEAPRARQERHGRMVSEEFLDEGRLVYEIIAVFAKLVKEFHSDRNFPLHHGHVLSHVLSPSVYHESVPLGEDFTERSR